MFLHPTQSAQLVALRQARYLEEAAISRMVPRRPWRRRLAALVTQRRNGRAEAVATAGRSLQRRPAGDPVVAD
jgi:hypothetical protein